MSSDHLFIAESSGLIRVIGFLLKTACVMQVSFFVIRIINEWNSLAIVNNVILVTFSIVLVILGILIIMLQ